MTIVVPPRHKHIWVMNKDERLFCGVCKKTYEAKTGKNYKPRSSAYVTPERMQEIIKAEYLVNERHGLMLELMFRRGLRLSDVIGIYKKYHIFHGLRPCDIDAVKLPHANHTMRLVRKKEKFKIMTLPDDLYNALKAHIKKYEVKSDERVFPYHRTTVYGWCAKYGKCVDERYIFGPHCIRRTYAKDYASRGGNLANLQQHMSHTQLSQTLEYIGGTEDAANKEQIEFDKMEAGE